MTFNALVQPLYSSSREQAKSLATDSGLRGPCFLSLEAKGMVSPNPKSTKGLWVPKNLSNISWTTMNSFAFVFNAVSRCVLYRMCFRWMVLE